MAGVGVLQHRDYLRVAEGNLELIRNDLWDIDITMPTAVYNPGTELLKVRLTSVETGQVSEPVLIEKKILGHTVYSPGGRDSSPAEVTLNFIDREDQAITFMINDYRDQNADARTSFGRHKSELITSLVVTFYNTLLKPVRKITYYDGMYGGSTLPNAIGEHGSDNSEVALNIKFQHHEVTYL